MEGELYNTIQKQELQGIPATPFVPKFPDISFAPSGEGVSQERRGPSRFREVGAMIGLVMGSISVAIALIVIALGIFSALLGLLFSYVGLRSSRRSKARIGLYLSLAGGSLSLLYMFAVLAGIVNYNFFTNDLWVLLTISLQK